MVEFFNTRNTITINHNGQLLLYPFPLVVKMEAVDRDNGVLRALSFNYFSNDTEVDEFVEELTDTYSFIVNDRRGRK